jgi:hypothetical protein
MKLKTLALAITATVASFSAAAETPYGDLITNTANLSYSVAGGTSVDTTATAEFNVDRLVKFNLTAANTTANAEVGEDTTIGFTLTNNSNAPMDYSLPTLDDVTYFIDANGDGVLDAGETTVVPATISLAQDDGNNGTSTHVYNYIAVYSPEVGVDGETIEVLFSATAIENDAALGTPGTVIVPTPAATAWDEDVVQTVAESNTAGEFIITQPEPVTFTYVGANIALAKVVEVVSDPVSLSANAPSGYTPKAIPGAVLKYTLTVTNSGAKDADLTLSDVMPSIFSVSDIKANSYLQSINGATATDISTNVTVATDSGTDIVTITFPAVTATANNGTDGTVVTSFEVTLP